jgi:hypothetical protein
VRRELCWTPDHHSCGKPGLALLPVILEEQDWPTRVGEVEGESPAREPPARGGGGRHTGAILKRGLPRKIEGDAGSGG